MGECMVTEKVADAGVEEVGVAAMIGVKPKVSEACQSGGITLPTLL